MIDCKHNIPMTAQPLLRGARVRVADVHVRSWTTTTMLFGDYSVYGDSGG